MHIKVEKSSHTITVRWSLPRHSGMVPEGKYSGEVQFKDGVVTNVIKNTDGATSSEFADEHSAEATDYGRKQNSVGGQTNPTQVKNGVYRIQGFGTPSSNAGNVSPEFKFGEGDLGLALDVCQLLPNVDTGELIRDYGYMFHITPAWFTSGCVGFNYIFGNKKSREAAEARVRFILDIIKETMGRYGDKNVVVEFAN